MPFPSVGTPPVPDLSGVYERISSIPLAAAASQITSSSQFLVGQNGFPAALAVAAASNRGARHAFDPADYAVTGKTTKLRLRVEFEINDVAPGQDVLFDLFPVSGMTGGSTTTDTLGASVASLTFTAPAANSHPAAQTVEITAPAAGLYVVGIKSAAAWTANALLSGSAGLAVRWV